MKKKVKRVVKISSRWYLIDGELYWRVSDNKFVKVTPELWRKSILRYAGVKEDEDED